MARRLSESIGPLALIAALAALPAGTALADEDGVSYGGAGTTNNSTAAGAASIAASSSGGAAASAAGSNSIALGVAASAANLATIAIGQNATATGIGGLAIGSSLTGTSASGADSVAIAAGAQATAIGAVAIGQNSAASGANSIALGFNSVASAASSVAIGQGSVATAPNTASFGAPGSERRLTNIAAGVNATDAVNMSQLAGITSNFDARFNAMQQQIDQNRTEARRGIAATAALAIAMAPSAPGKTTVSLNTAMYRGETGVGVAVAHRLKIDLRQTVIVHGSYANAGGTDHVGRLGFGIEF
jgi:hypothetical protein